MHVLALGSILLALVHVASAQELEPRTYAAAPVGTNILVVGYGRSMGGITFDPALPVTDVKASINTQFCRIYPVDQFLWALGKCRRRRAVCLGQCRGKPGGYV